MRERCTNDLAVRMYIHGVTQDDVAKELGVTRAAVGMMLNGKRGTRDPEATLEKLTNAVEAIIARRKSA